ncbi:hypothetical protein BJX64DRAFT_293263 [Aspergillus heterothallicus]
MANRMQEAFNVFLASFWILFVYLHRVCWWSLAHSSTPRTALEEVGKHLQSAYGEWTTDDDNEKKKVVHPALLWPVFLFGAECVEEERQNWAVDQLQALAEARPALQLYDDEDEEILPPFRMGLGATRNAKRAAVLLRELANQQTSLGARVDDRDLSMKLFGCHFSFSISLRDQAIALSRREPLQTIPAALESRMQSLDQARLDDEIEQSIIYLPSTKRVLGHLFQLQCQLSRLLARVIPLAFGDIAHRHQRDPSLTVQLDIDYLKLDLAVWDMNRKTMVDQALRNSCVDRIVHIHTHILSVYYQWVNPDGHYKR